MLHGGGDRGSGEPSATACQCRQRRARRLVAARVERDLVRTHPETLGEDRARPVEQGTATTACGVAGRAVRPREVMCREEGLEGLGEERSGDPVEQPADPRRGSRVSGVLLDRISLSRHAMRLVPPFDYRAGVLR